MYLLLFFYRKLSFVRKKWEPCAHPIVCIDFSRWVAVLRTEPAQAELAVVEAGQFAVRDSFALLLSSK